MKRRDRAAAVQTAQRRKSMGDTRADVGRREFCLATLGGVGLAVLGPLGKALAASSPQLAAVKGEAGPAARRAVEILGGMGRFVKKGETVVVKPNIGWDRTPEQAANTSPEVVREVLRMCLEAEAGEVLVFDRTCNDPRLCYRRSGIGAAVEEVGGRRVKLFHPDRRKYVNVAIPGGKALKEWKLYEEAVTADVFINVPVAKHHSLSGLTMGLKNVMGVMGGNRGQIHSGFDDKIIDINLARPSHLTILDATRVLLRHGPQGGRLEDVGNPGVVVASTDIVAADAYATRFFDLMPGDIGHVRRAAERGLGTMDLSRVTVREENI